MSDFKKIVKVHNNFVEAIYSLELTAKKLLLSVILHLNDSNKIEISREELIREVGIDLGRKDKVERELPIRELMTKLITIREINSSNFAIYQLLKATKYKDGMFYTSVYKDLLPYFQEVKERLYTKFNILNIKPLSSVYAIRVFEMCKQFESTGWLTLELAELKKRLKIEGQYSRIYDLKKWVLNVAVKQINENTDININYKLRKQGKAYKYIDFTIKRQQQNPKLFEAELTDIQKELGKFIGKKIEGKHIIKSFRLFNDMIVADTEIGEYQFPNIETLKGAT
jgi:plasmid replication initiation protein